jgi:dUTP pyrophosphatase
MQMPQMQMPQIQMPLQMPLQYQNNMSAGVTAVLGQSMKTHKIYRPYFQLEIYVPKPTLTSTSSAGAFASASYANNLRTLYESMVSEHNKVTLPLIVGTPGECNAGFDLLTPTTMCATGYNTVKIDHIVKCRMSKILPHSSHPINVFQDANGILRQYNTTILPVGFYLYPRSSTGTKTPLRLANSVGIIDSGYRGPLIAAFDNWKKDDFEIQENQRLVQICAPDLSYPIYVILVDTEEELGKTNRGSGGFGSTG